MTVIDLLPTINACLNGISTILLISAFIAVKKGNVERHKKLMLTAFGTSSLFLAGYLIRQYFTGTHYFHGSPAMKYTYFVILFTHMPLAMITVPLVLRAYYLALKDRIEEHRKIVRYTFPIWLYVSITGVLVYIMLYHLSDTPVS